MNIEWATILINAQSQTENNWDYRITISDGYIEDLVISGIYPNPNTHRNSRLKIKLLSSLPQKIKINIYNILGQNIINWNTEIAEPNEIELQWDKKNRQKQIVSDGVYFIEVEGKRKRIVEKIVLLKSSD